MLGAPFLGSVMQTSHVRRLRHFLRVLKHRHRVLMRGGSSAFWQGLLAGHLGDLLGALKPLGSGTTAILEAETIIGAPVVIPPLNCFIQVARLLALLLEGRTLDGPGLLA